VVQGSVAVVEDPNTVPQLGVILWRSRKGAVMRTDLTHSDLGGRKQIKGLLISGVRSLQFVTHEVTMAYESRIIRVQAPLGGK
jgi:hypothetical protein